MGLFVAFRGAEKIDNDNLTALAKDYMKRVGMDRRHLLVVSSIIKLYISKDLTQIKKAQRDLDLDFTTLGLVAKRFLNPHDVDLATLERLFTDYDFWSDSRNLLWVNQPKECDDWCYAVCQKISPEH